VLAISESKITEVPIRQPAVRSVFPLGGHEGQKVAVELAGDLLDPKGSLGCEWGDPTGNDSLRQCPVAERRDSAGTFCASGPGFFYLETRDGEHPIYSCFV
jgi:hypothetical protein